MKRIWEICETRVRYGYRRVHVLLDRDGWGINFKKVYCIYRELGMQLRVMFITSAARVTFSCRATASNAARA